MICRTTWLSVNIFLSLLVATPWLRLVGSLSSLALLLGALAGGWLYGSSLIFFFGYRDLRSATNVLPGEGAGGLVDAGLISFR